MGCAASTQHAGPAPVVRAGSGGGGASTPGSAHHQPPTPARSSAAHEQQQPKANAQLETAEARQKRAEYSPPAIRVEARAETEEAVAPGDDTGPAPGGNDAVAAAGPTPANEEPPAEAPPDILIANSEADIEAQHQPVPAALESKIVTETEPRNDEASAEVAEDTLPPPASPPPVSDEAAPAKEAAATAAAAASALTGYSGRLQLRQVMCLQGHATTCSRSPGELPAEGRDELLELLQVWHRDWHGYPAWHFVTRARTLLRNVPAAAASAAAGTAAAASAAEADPGAAGGDGGASSGDVWSSLSNAERRMLCEVTALDKKVRIFLNLNNETEEGAAALHLKVLAAARSRRKQAQPAVAAAGAGAAAAAAAAAAVSVSTADNGGGSGEAVEAGGVRERNLFVGIMSMMAFLSAHQLTDARADSCHPGLLFVSGRTAGLSVREVAERIVGPALEASGGASYAETFFIQYSTCTAPTAAGAEVGDRVPSTGEGDDKEVHPPSGAKPAAGGGGRGQNPMCVFVPNPDPSTGLCGLVEALYDIQKPDPKTTDVRAWLETFSAPPACWSHRDASAATAAAVAAAAAAASMPQGRVALFAGTGWPRAIPGSWAAPAKDKKGAAVPPPPPPPHSELLLPPCLTSAAALRQLQAATALEPVIAVDWRHMHPYGSSNNWTVSMDDRHNFHLAWVVRVAAVSAEAEAVAATSQPPAAMLAAAAAAAGGVPLAEDSMEGLWRKYQKVTSKFLTTVKTLLAAAHEATLKFRATDWSSGPTARNAVTVPPPPPPPGGATLQITRVLQVEVPPEGQEEAGPKLLDGVGLPPGRAVALALTLEVQELACPPDMAQEEADSLAAAWATDWRCTPDWARVLRVRAASGGGDPSRVWARLSNDRRRAACELALLYGDEAAAWAPSEEAEAAAREVSSNGAFVNLAFVNRFASTQMHNLLVVSSAYPFADYTGPNLKCLAGGSRSGAQVWSPSGEIYNATTTWVCANLVLPATKGYGMSYHDLFLNREVQARFRPDLGADGPYGAEAEDAPKRAFASHAWATDFLEFIGALTTNGETTDVKYYWIDIFHKNQWQGVRESDLRDNLKLAGAVSLVVHPFPQPLAITRVWCLYELLTALEVGVDITPARSKEAFQGFVNAMWVREHDYDFSPSQVTPQVRAAVEALDVTTAQATVPADKDMILGLIRGGIGIDQMNARVRELFMRLVQTVIKPQVDEHISQQSGSVCFGGDGVVRCIPAPAAYAARESAVRPRRRRLRQSQCQGRSGSRRAPGLPTHQQRGSLLLAALRVGCRSKRRELQQPACYTRTGGGGGRPLLLPLEPAVITAVAVPRRVVDLRPGDQLVTADGGVSRVVLVTVDEVGPAGMELCELPLPAAAAGRGGGGAAAVAAAGVNGDKCGVLSSGSGSDALSGCSGGGSSARSSSLLVTPDHPVKVCGVWRLPRHLAPVKKLPPEQVPHGAVFNLELDPPGPLRVSGLELVGLGQDSSAERRQGVDPASDALFGWGWRDNPERARRLAAQQAREAARWEQVQTKGQLQDEVQGRAAGREALPPLGRRQFGGGAVAAADDECACA